MYIVVVGAGQLGYYLAKDLIGKGNEVTLVDWNFSKVQALEQELGGVILYASGSSIEGLEKAGCERAEVIVAATGHDEDNLVICQLGKRYFKIPKAIARINNPKNEQIFRELGVGTTISGTKSIADAIEAYLMRKKYRTLLLFNQGEAELVEVDITADSISLNKKISSLNLPENCVVTLILRGKEVLFPKGGTRLENGDIVIIATSSADRESVKSAFQGTGE